MNLLGLDSSTPASVACVVRADGAAFEADRPLEALTGPPAHARELMPAVARALDGAGIGFGELDAVAVGVGPGAFTGLRIGVSAARAIAAARDIELRPVSSLAALAHGSDESLALALIDARRGELFAAVYERGEERIEPFVGVPEAVADRVRKAGFDPLAAGNGSVRFRDTLESAGIRVAPAGSRSHLAGGLAVCRLGAAAAAVPPATVRPDYLRAPDAKPQP